MQNLYWYIGLALIGIGVLAFSVYKKRKSYRVSTLLVFALAVSSAAWIAEFTVLGVFDSYFYKTGMFTDQWAQNLLGHLILNGTVYPAAAVVVVAFSLKRIWSLAIGAIFTSIEYLFIRLDLYEDHWWHYYMTFIAVVIFVNVSINWFGEIVHKSFGFIRAITFFFVAMIIIHIPAPVLLLMEKQTYRIPIINDFVGNMNRSSIIIIFSYHLIEAFLIMFMTVVLKKRHWRLLVFLIPAAAQSLFAFLGILVFENGWTLAGTIIVYEIFVACYVLIEKHTLRPSIKQ